MRTHTCGNRINSFRSFGKPQMPEKKKEHQRDTKFEFLSVLINATTYQHDKFSVRFWSFRWKLKSRIDFMLEYLMKFYYRMLQESSRKVYTENYMKYVWENGKMVTNSLHQKFHVSKIKQISPKVAEILNFKCFHENNHRMVEVNEKIK